MRREFLILNNKKTKSSHTRVWPIEMTKIDPIVIDCHWNDNQMTLSCHIVALICHLEVKESAGVFK